MSLTTAERFSGDYTPDSNPGLGGSSSKPNWHKAVVRYDRSIQDGTP